MKKDEINYRVVSTFDQRFYYIEKNGVGKYCDSITHTLGQVRRKPYLDRLRGERGNFEMDNIIDAALAKGSNEHLAFDTLLRGGVVVFNDNKKPAYTPEEIDSLKTKHKHWCILRNDFEMLEVYRMVLFYKMINPKILASEMTLFDYDRGVAGTCDSIWMIEGGDYELKITPDLLADVTGRDAIKQLLSGIAKPDIITLPKGKVVIDWKTGKGFDADEYSMQISEYIEMAEADAGMIVWTNNQQKKKGIPGLSVLVVTKEESKEYHKDFMDIHRHFVRYYRSEPTVYDIPTIIGLN